VGDTDAALSSFAAERGLETVPAFDAGPLTPLLVESGDGRLEPAARGDVGEGFDGTVGRLAYKRNKTFRFDVALTEVAVSTAFAPRLFCVHRERRTRDDEYYGFEARDSKLWTESIGLDERYSVTTSPYQDENWLRQLFSPAFIDWLVSKPPTGFSFELAYGALLGSVEAAAAADLGSLLDATAHVAACIRRECEE
jgi:hypothetical protein